ncbi:MAG: VOC family protein [Bacillus sp. (in: firmicutes)]
MQKGLIHHIELYVSDLQVSKQFWGWLLEEELGFNVDREWKGGVSYRLGDGYIVFCEAKEAYLDIPYHRCRVGLNHLAFHADSKQHVDDIKDKLQAKGIKPLYEDRYPYAGGEDHYALFFEDPDRIKVEVVAPE